MGGMATVAASVAVVCAVAMTNSVALADSPGVDVAAARVLVPAASSGTTPETSASTGAVHRPEVAEAPAPVDVADSAPSAPVEPSTTPVTPASAAPEPAPAAPAPPASAGEAVDASHRAGTWDAVRAWALAHGWSQKRIDAWISRLEEERAAAERDSASERESASADRDREHGAEQGPPAGLVPADPRERPANAGSNADREERSSDSSHGDTKKDRSRNPPDRRDR